MELLRAARRSFKLIAAAGAGTGAEARESTDRAALGDEADEPPDLDANRSLRLGAGDGAAAGEETDDATAAVTFVVALGPAAGAGTGAEARESTDRAALEDEADEPPDLDANRSLRLGAGDGAAAGEETDDATAADVLSEVTFLVSTRSFKRDGDKGSAPAT